MKQKKSLSLKKPYTFSFHLTARQNKTREREKTKPIAKGIKILMHNLQEKKRVSIVFYQAENPFSAKYDKISKMLSKKLRQLC